MEVNVKHNYATSTHVCPQGYYSQQPLPLILFIQLRQKASRSVCSS
uniref:Uncharacterized protein n=1 Tax=Arundo donax TaxID=35708 RepID=A0A0A9CCI1_ARUDO